MSRTIGSPSCIIHHPLLRHPSLLPSSADNFATPPSPLYLTLLSSPRLPLLSFALPLFPLSLLTVTLMPQGPQPPSRCDFSVVVVLDGSRIKRSLATFPKKSPPLPSSLNLIGLTDSWLPTRGGAFDLHSLQESRAAFD